MQVRDGLSAARRSLTALEQRAQLVRPKVEQGNP